jgi:hypothetical protein
MAGVSPGGVNEGLISPRRSCRPQIKRLSNSSFSHGVIAAILAASIFQIHQIKPHFAYPNWHAREEDSGVSLVQLAQ